MCTKIMYKYLIATDKRKSNKLHLNKRSYTKNNNLLKYIVTHNEHKIASI